MPSKTTTYTSVLHPTEHDSLVQKTGKILSEKHFKEHLTG